MLSIIAIVVAVATCVFVGISRIASVKSRKRERQLLGRAIMALRRNNLRHLTGALARNVEEIESAINVAAQKAAESQMPAVLEQLRAEQREVNVKFAQWMRREEKRFRILLNMRVEPIEASAEHAATLASRVLDWFNRFKPWGHTAGAKGSEKPDLGTNTSPT